MSKEYDAIMALSGAEELQALIRKWETLSENLSTRNIGAPILLPDLLMYTRRGYGNTTLLRLMANYLESKKNLMDFFGDVKFMEFMLNYCPPEEPFTELYRLIEEIRDAAGFRSGFRGIVRININEWVGHHEEKHFLDFLEYMSSNSQDWLNVITISREPDEKTREIEALLSMYLRIEVVVLHIPETDVILDRISGWLAEYGLTVDMSGREVLRGSVDKLRENKHFDGMHTIRLLCSDIVYNYYSNAANESTVLSEASLRSFAADSEYINRTILKIERQRVGF